MLTSEISAPSTRRNAETSVPLVPLLDERWSPRSFDPRATISDQQFLHGPLADAMTHAGQLAMLRRLAGDAVPSENFIFAKIGAENLSSRQAEPVAPDKSWSAEQGHIQPGLFKE